VTATERAPSRTAEAIFDPLARRYDRTNTALTLGLDAAWRAATAEALDAPRGGLVLDLCAGTLELTGALLARTPTQRVVATDRAGHMLAVGRHKAPGARAVQGCALALPFASGAFDAATMGFGLRNLPDPVRGLAEARRVLKRGARLAILEFVHPTGALANLAHVLGVRFVVPIVGGILGGQPGAFRYLARTIDGFHTLEGLKTLVLSAGFTIRTARVLGPFGPAALVVGEAP
jgi:ubiquinone/menaquinone biosynthesis methyltransferase